MECKWNRGISMRDTLTNKDTLKDRKANIPHTFAQQIIHAT